MQRVTFGRHGGRSTWMPAVMAAGLVMGTSLALSTQTASASDWAFQQMETAKRQQLGFSDSTGTSTLQQPRRSRAYGSQRSQRSSTRHTRVAARGDTRRDFDDTPSYSRSTGRSLSGGSVIWQASASCLNGSLRAVVASVAANFGPVRVSSTCRSHGHNRRVGGAPQSLHLTGNAVDFRVLSGSPGAVMAFLRSSGSVGGIKHYGGGLFHIDTGARRSW